MDGQCIESPWGQDFSHPSRRSWSPPSLLYNGYRVFPVGKAWRWHPPPTSAEVKERARLYLYSPSGLSLSVQGRTLPLHFPLLLQHILCHLDSERRLFSQTSASSFCTIQITCKIQWKEQKKNFIYTGYQGYCPRGKAGQERENDHSSSLVRR